MLAANVAEALLWIPDDWSLLSNVNHMIKNNQSNQTSLSNKRNANNKDCCPWLQLKYQLVKSDIKLWIAFLAIEVLFGRKNTAEHQLKIGFISRLKTRDILGVLNFCNINVMEG